MYDSAENQTHGESGHELPFANVRTTDHARCRAVMVDALNKAIEVFCSHNELTFHDVLSNSLRPIADAIEVGRIIVYFRTVKDGKDFFTQLYRWDKKEGVQTPESLDVLPDNRVINEWKETLMQNIYINKRLGDMTEYEKEFMNIFGIMSILVIPIFTHGKFWGAVAFLDHINERRFEKNCIDLIQSSAQLTAYAVKNAERGKEIFSKNELTRVMFDTAPIGLTMFDSNYKFIDCNEAVLEMYGVSRQYYLNHFFDLSPEFQPDGSNSRDKTLMIMKRTLGGEKLVMEWMHRSPDGEPIPCEITTSRIRYNDKYFGIGYVYDLRHIRELERDIQKLETEANKIYYDGLTGIHNRRYFDDNLKRLMAALSRSNSMLSMMMIDIDFFKNYNDTYGHHEGDNCLRIIAETISRSISRTDDIVARYGGEEFAVVLPNTDAYGACMIAEKLLENIRKYKLPHKSSSIADIVTVSIGVTTGKAEYTQKAEDYIKRADELLYKSKQSGRNRYTFDKFQ